MCSLAVPYDISKQALREDIFRGCAVLITVFVVMDVMGVNVSSKFFSMHGLGN